MPSNSRGMIRPYESQLDFAVRLIDTLWIAATLRLGCAIYDERWTSNQTLVLALSTTLFYLVGQGTGLYRTARGAPLSKEIWRVWLSWGLVVTALLFGAFATKTSADHSRKLTLTWALLAPTLISVSRVFLRSIAQEARARGFNTRTVAIVGASALGARLAERIKRSPWMGLRVTGFFDDRSLQRLGAEGEPFDIELSGGFDKVIEEARTGNVDLVYIALPPRAEPRIAELIRRLADTTASVYLAYDFGGFDLLRAQWSSVGDIPVMSVVENPFYGSDGMLKRVEDVVLGLAILALISLPMAIISLGVKLSSPGPVFFRQRRYGLNGEEIRVLKFRTMTVCEDGDRVVQARKGDQRITRFGALLRRTSLDELPQFLQVVSGTMSIVGPRPHAIAHNEQYRSLIQGYMLRHKVKPGITGWAQVNGWRGETDTLEKMKRRVEYDLEYIRDWKLGFDLKIILMTVRQVLGGHENAY